MLTSRFVIALCNTSCRPLDCTALEEKLQQWTTGRSAKVWISTDIVLKHLLELTCRDFSNYKKHGLGKAPEHSGVDVFVDMKTKKIVSLYIIDKATNETDYVCYRHFKEFLSCYVKNFVARPGQFMDEMFDEHGTWLHGGLRKNTLAETMFGITPGKRGARLSLLKILEGLKDLLPTPIVPVEKRNEPEGSELPPQVPPSATDHGPKRRSAGSCDLLEGLAPMPTDYEMSREARGAFEFARIMMNHSDGGCIMMTLVEEILLTELQKDDVREIVDNYPDRALENYLTETLRAAISSIHARNFPALLHADLKHSGPSSSTSTPKSPYPSPAMLLKGVHLRSYVRRFRPALVGREASTYALRRLQQIGELRKDFYATQYFCPPRNPPLKTFFTDAANYSAGVKMLVAISSLLFRSRSSENEVIPASDESTRQAKKLRALGAARENMRSPNRRNQVLLSHRSIFILAVLKHAVGISDQKFLLMQYLMHFLYVGVPLTKEEAAGLTIGGDSLVQRDRQLTWAVKQQEVSDINSSKSLISASSDDTDHFGSNCGSRNVVFFDENLHAPRTVRVSGFPTNRKTASAGAQALYQSLRSIGINTDGRLVGGSSDNAPNARNAIFEAVDIADEFANGRDENGEIVRPVTNGVERRVVWVGSLVHILHLCMNNFRKDSFGAKSGGIGDASPGQLCYKWRKILTSDQRTSARGVSSVYLRLLVDFFNGQKGFWCKLPTEENEGRWGQSLQSRKEILEFIKLPIPEGREGLGGNCLAAAAMYIRRRIKPNSWQIVACHEVAVWSMNEKIVFMILVEVELGVFYERELNWLRRAGSTRAYLKNYPPDCKLREYPGHGHAHAQFVKKMESNVWSVLPESTVALEALSQEAQDIMKALVPAGAKAWASTFKKHTGWIHCAFGLVLQINSSGISGAVARGLVNEFPDEIFIGDNAGSFKQRAERAFSAAEVSSSFQVDEYWHRLIRADKENVLHFARQFHLFGGNAAERTELMDEWVRLSENTCTVPEDDVLIHDHFADQFPILHARQQLNVDPILTDTTSREAEFSVQGRVRIKQLTSSASEERMFWDSNVLTELRKVGREFGENARATKLTSNQNTDALDPTSAAARTGVKLWCRSHGQCAAVLAKIEDKFLPMFTPDKMENAPLVRKDLKIGDGFVAKDEAIVTSWTETLVTDSEHYRRDVPLSELQRKANDLVLTFDLPSECTEAIPLRRRLDLAYKSVRGDRLHTEFQCHLPLVLLCLRAMTKEGTWPTNSLTKLIMACLLPTRLPLSALSALDVATIAEATSTKQRLKAIEEVTEVQWCFNDHGRLEKKKKPAVLKYLDQFSWGALRILEFLGNHHADVQGESHFQLGAGSTAAMFILGPFLFGPENRALIGCKAAENGGVKPLPRHGFSGFRSALVRKDNENAELNRLVYG